MPRELPVVILRIFNTIGLRQTARYGPPALLVEVLSPSSRQTDRSAKGKRYAALGVRHYWIVDPDARRIECYRAAG